MFLKEIYTTRRRALAEGVRAAGETGLLLFVGNVEAPAQYKDNCYKFRQDSSWLYFWGLNEPRMAAIVDLESGEEKIFADDVEIDDIIWMGPQPSVASKAAQVGVLSTAPYGAFAESVRAALSAGRKVHYLPPSRYYNTLFLSELLGIPSSALTPSIPFIKAVIDLRLVKEACEVEELDKAGALGQEMHTIGRNNIIPGIIEQDIVGKMEAVTLAKGWGVSFPTILTQHGETLHNHLHTDGHRCRRRD